MSNGESPTIHQDSSSIPDSREWRGEQNCETAGSRTELLESEQSSEPKFKFQIVYVEADHAQDYSGPEDSFNSAAARAIERIYLEHMRHVHSSLGSAGNQPTDDAGLGCSAYIDYSRIDECPDGIMQAGQPEVLPEQRFIKDETQSEREQRLRFAAWHKGQKPSAVMRYFLTLCKNKDGPAKLLEHLVFTVIPKPDGSEKTAIPGLQVAQDKGIAKATGASPSSIRNWRGELALAGLLWAETHKSPFFLNEKQQPMRAMHYRPLFTAINHQLPDKMPAVDVSDSVSKTLPLLLSSSSKKDYGHCRDQHLEGQVSSGGRTMDDVSGLEQEWAPEPEVPACIADAIKLYIDAAKERAADLTAPRVCNHDRPYVRDVAKWLPPVTAEFAQLDGAPEDVADAIRQTADALTTWDGSKKPPGANFAKAVLGGRSKYLPTENVMYQEVKVVPITSHYPRDQRGNDNV